MGLFSVAGLVPLLLLYVSRDSTDDMKAKQTEGLLRRLLFRLLNVCGWSHRGPLAARTFTLLGQGSTLTTSTNGQKAALWWIREPDEKCCYKLATKAPKDRGYILVHFQLQTAEAR